MIGIVPIFLSGLLFLATNLQVNYNKRQKKNKSKLVTGENNIPTFRNEKPLTKTPIPSDQTNAHSKNTCSHSKTEEKCRQIIEKIYGLPFPPYNKFVINKETGRWLTLDGYNQSLKIAFEYQGEQHYKFPNFLSKQGKMTLLQFKKGIYRDRLKKMACERAGITLFIIPYTQDRRLENFIRELINSI